MASIDKIYGTLEQYDEFHAWCLLHKPEALKRFYPRDGFKTPNDRPITNFSTEMDEWMWDNCPLAWVRARLAVQYGWDDSHKEAQ